jgi:acyl-CoA thioester hydrolase
MPTYVETHRATVAPADCDDLGHMNVQHYFAAVSDGMFRLMARVGLTPEEIRRHQRSFAVVRAEGEFLRELHAGDMLVLESTVLQFGDRSATFHHRLRHAATGTVAMTAHFTCVFLDLETRRVVTIPDDLRSAAVEMFADEV